MEIEKLTKKKASVYEIIFSNGKKIQINEDVIIKYNLFKGKNIEDKLMNNIISDNEKEKVYTKVIRYISIRIRSKWEIEKYLEKYETDKKYILDKLDKQGYINDDAFARAFVNDKMTFNNWGPYKIKKELIKYYIDKNIIDKYISNIDKEVIYIKLEREINKKVKTNKTKTVIALKKHLFNYFSNLGYEISMIKEIFENIDIIDDPSLLNKEYNKTKIRLSRKYKGKELELKIKQHLITKGFNYNDIKNNN